MDLLEQWFWRYSLIIATLARGNGKVFGLREYTYFFFETIPQIKTVGPGPTT